MARVIEKIVYKFDELSDRAKEQARDWWRQCENENFDSSFILDDVMAVAKILGIDINQSGGSRYEPDIYWSGFSSQGDGACFEGSYGYAKGATKKIREYAPEDQVLHSIADNLQEVQRKTFYRLTAGMYHRDPYYYHANTMRVEVEDSRRGYHAVSGEAEAEITRCMRAFADWIYHQLEMDYRYRMSDENVDESIILNEYEFDGHGEIV